MTAEDIDQWARDSPHATYLGEDAQVDAAVGLLKHEIAQDPRPVPQAAAYPDKAY